ncbi:hypothetical protein KUTeg_001448 [Tegillarca granosa]|uniref:Sfi1 spindle body domain-containing protein n=1 Tax=Tegillarca granosa TaxID=220873 RepID=A0ABQ9FSY3_TEGGR|nr:hypothetical protein KUTeg_001448 [Tegillarca granosa]
MTTDKMSRGYVESRNILFSDYYGNGNFGGPFSKSSTAQKQHTTDESKIPNKHSVISSARRERKHASLKNVKRKLDFNDEEESGREINHGDLDFTDKIAAFRSILKPMKEESRSFGQRLMEKKTFTKVDDLSSDTSSKRRLLESESNSSTLFSRSSDLDLKALYKNDDPKVLLSHLADQELARQSYINYEANSFVWLKLKQQLHSNNTEEKTSDSSSYDRNDKSKGKKSPKKHDDSDKDYLSKFDSLIGKGKINNSKEKLGEEKSKTKKSVSGKNNRKKKDTEGLSGGSDNKRRGKHTVHENIEYKHDRGNVKTQEKKILKTFQSRFESDLDNIPQREISDICKLICDTESMCQTKTNDHVGSPTLTYVPNLESPQHSEFSKSRQSNVPLFSESLTPRRGNGSQRKDDILKTQIDGIWNKFSREAKYEDFSKRNIKMNDTFLSLENKDFKQTNVEHYVGTPRSDLLTKNTDRHGSSTEKSPASSKRKKSRSRSKDVNKRNYSKSPDRKKHVKNKEDIEELNLSDSSKENIPSSRIPPTNRDNGILTIHDLSSSHSERNRNEKQDERNRKKRLNTEAKNDNLQFIPEKETKNKNKDNLELPVDGYVLHNAEKTSDAESRNSDITSVTGSARSSGSQSSTVRAVELLRRLYKTDSQTRENLILKARCFRRWLKNVKKLKYKYDGNESDNWYVFRALQQDMKIETENNVTAEVDNEKINVLRNLVKRENGFESAENVQTESGIRRNQNGESSTGKDSKTWKGLGEKDGVKYSIELAGNETVNTVHLLNTDHVTKTEEPIISQKYSLEQFQIYTNTGSLTSKPQSNTISHSNFGSKQMTGVVKGTVWKKITSNKNGENLASADSLGNIALTETAQLLDTVNYGMCLQRAEVFYRHLFLKKYFTLWKQMTVEHLRYKSAVDMARKHLLRKAMKGFMWSINRSKIQIDIFQSRMKSISLMTAFTKWRNSAMENRQRRLRVAFSRWQEFTVESQKIRRLRQLADKKILIRSLQQWKVRFSMRLKENAADYHYRKKLLSVQITQWKIFTQQSKEKCHRNNMAVEFRNEHLQRVVFTEMVVVFKKHCQAQQHYRIVELRRVFMSWLRSAHVCKLERQRDMSISREHWRMVTIKHYFVQWHEELLTHRATKSANRKLLKNSFLIWRTSWQENVQYRLAVEAEIRQQILKASLRLWFDNVQLLKQRREVAVIYIQRVLVRHILKKWSLYTQYKKELRVIHKEFVNKLNLKKEEKFWKTWRSKFQDRLDVQKAQTFWSNFCVRKAVDRWKRKCHKSRLQHLLQTSEPDRQLNLQRVMFSRWLLAKQNIEAEKQEADQTRKILEKSELLRRFKIWRVATQQQLTIKPLLIRRERHIVTRVFDEWQNLVKHKGQCRKSKDLYIKSRLAKLFSSWKQQYQLHQIEKDVKQRTIKNQLKHCVDGWRFVIKRKHAAVKFYQKNLVKSMFAYWRDKAFSQLHDKMEAKEIQEWNTSLLKYYFDLWFTNIQQQITEREEVTILMKQQRSVNLIKSSFTSWRRHFRATLVAREYRKMQGRKLLQQLFVKWNEVTKYGLKEAVHKFATRLGLQSPYQDEFTNSTGSEPGKQMRMIRLYIF